MNTIYFGRGAYGIDAAAQAYFGHGAHELTLSESALLAAVIPAPSAWDPAVNPDKAKERWERDLNLMVEDGWLTQAERDAAERAEQQVAADQEHEKHGVLPRDDRPRHAQQRVDDGHERLPDGSG